MNKCEKERAEVISSEEITVIYEIQQVKLKTQFITSESNETKIEGYSSFLVGMYPYQVTNSIRLDVSSQNPDYSDKYLHKSEITAYRLVKQDNQTVLYYAKTKEEVERYLTQITNGNIQSI